MISVRPDIQYKEQFLDRMDESRKFGITNVLMTCRSSNLGSAKSIKNNGGVYEGESIVKGKPEQRHWIDNSQ